MMNNRIRMLLAVMAVMLVPVLTAGAATIKDLARVYGPMENPVVGYGLVVGLSGTGDDTKFSPASKLFSNMLTNLGAGSLPIEVRNSKNVAVVMISGKLPPFSRVGDIFDVEVSAVGNAKSLAGGQLVVCPLTAGDQMMYAVASGLVQVDEERPTAGRVSQGGIVQKSVPYELTPGNKVTFKLLPQNADYSVATRIVNAIHQDLNIDTSTGAAPVARAVDAATIEVTLNQTQAANPVAFISQLERVTIPTLDYVMEARVVIDERNETYYAMNGNVEISPAFVGQRNIQIQIKPVSGSDTTTLDELVTAFKLLNATPADVIAVMNALEASGALHAKVIRK
jgi:flagellar P-ring protein precursor FlgI